MSYSRVERKLEKWVESLNGSIKEMLLEALQDGTLLKRTFWKHLEDAKPTAEQQVRELEKMGIKPEELFEEIKPETLSLIRDCAVLRITQYENYCKRTKTENPQIFRRLVEAGECTPDGTVKEETKQYELRVGITLKAFEIALQQLQIPFVPNHPTIDWRSRSEEELGDEPTNTFLSDFWVPLMGKIDIESATSDNPTVNINLNDFEKENPHYVVAYQILDIIQPRWLRLSGFMYRSEIRKQYEPIDGVDRPFYSIPIEDFETKHDARELCSTLLIVRNVMKNILGPSD